MLSKKHKKKMTKKYKYEDLIFISFKDKNELSMVEATYNIVSNDFQRQYLDKCFLIYKKDSTIALVYYSTISILSSKYVLTTDDYINIWRFKTIKDKEYEYLESLLTLDGLHAIYFLASACMIDDEIYLDVILNHPWNKKDYKILLQIMMNDFGIFNKEDKNIFIKKYFTKNNIELKELKRLKRLTIKLKKIKVSKAIKNTKNADMVITSKNYAVALLYGEARVFAPVVISSGYKTQSILILKIAKENNIPIIKKHKLAKALYEQIQINNYITEFFFDDIAIALAKVYELKKQT